MRSCLLCLQCVETFAIPETRGNLSHPDPCGSITPQLYVGIRSNALVTQISRVPFSRDDGNNAPGCLLFEDSSEDWVFVFPTF